MSDDNEHKTDANGADKEQAERRLIENAYGNRFYTLEALQDRIIAQFFEEMADRDDLLSALDTSKKQRQALRDAMDYIVATEYVVLTTNEKRRLLDTVQREIFHLGPLDAALKDEAITEISIASWYEISVRRGFGKLEPYANVFETYDHLEQLLPYVLAPLGVTISEEDPFLDVGVPVAGRQLRLSLSGPPLQRAYTGIIRLHPSKPLQFADLAASIPLAMQEMLQSIVEKGHGLLIVGEGGQGKTTLLANLLQFGPPNAVVLQRAGEIHPEMVPDGIENRVAVPREAPTTTVFEQMLGEVVQATPAMVLLDEIHGDEQRGLWPLLHTTAVPVVMTFRGRAVATRMYSALTMALRRSSPTVEQADIERVLLERLPFVAAMATPQPGIAPRLMSIGQWIRQGGQMQIEPLMQWQDTPEPVRTAATPRFEL
jgi:type IV secretory pathway ATPase VirB11/archaellum biosynthesis ATPase